MGVHGEWTSTEGVIGGVNTRDVCHVTTLCMVNKKRHQYGYHKGRQTYTYEVLYLLGDPITSLLHPNRNSGNNPHCQRMNKASTHHFYQVDPTGISHPGTPTPTTQLIIYPSQQT